MINSQHAKFGSVVRQEDSREDKEALDDQPKSVDMGRSPLIRGVYSPFNFTIHLNEVHRTIHSSLISTSIHISVAKAVL